MNNIAAIDIGTNSFHVIVVKHLSEGNFEIIDREKEVIRLGEGNTGDIKVIQPAAMERAIATLKRFKGLADSHNADVRAVATSAVRESLNKNEFKDRALNEAGIQVEVISGIEEARLIYLGVMKAVPVFEKHAFCFDIGGGSTEFTVGHKGKINYSDSLKLGAVRLTQSFFPDFKVTKSKAAECRKWVEGNLTHVVRETAGLKKEIAVASSGTAIAVASMIAAKKHNISDSSFSINNYSIDAEDIFELEEEILSCKRPEDRKRIPGLDSKRTDIIPAGIILLAAIVRTMGFEKLYISDFALREGIIIDHFNKFYRNPLMPMLKDIRRDSVTQLAQSSRFPKGHCEHVTKLALSIFDQTKELHNLGDNAREYLEAASRLHDIGHQIAHSQHHRHTQYIITHSELLGFNESEIQIIAGVARYHRKSHPKNRHKEFAALPEEDKTTVKKLSAILRVADALDRTHNSTINEIKVESVNGTVTLKLECMDENADIELWNLERRKELFEEVFEKVIQTEVLFTSVN